MAISLVTGNLQQNGDNGAFEADPSTWGFTSTVGTPARSSALKWDGLYSALLTEFYAGARAYGTEFARGKFNGINGRKYVCRAKVRTPSANVYAANNYVIRLTAFEDYLYGPANSTGHPINYTFISRIDHTILEATDTWVEIELKFQLVLYGPSYPSGTANGLVVNLILNPPGGTDQFGNNVNPTSANIGGKMHVDKFEIFEYIDVVAPPSTLAINKPGSTITNASGPIAADGSIIVAITGGTAPFEYSKNNGATWQPSNLFSGLLPGNYQVKVREQTAPANVVSDVYTVGVVGALFDFTIAITHESVIGANDGQLLLTPSGAGAPFTYKIQTPDGAIGYQAGNLFPGLPPNGYDVFVKDTSGNVLQKYALILPGALAYDKVYFSKNQIPFGKVGDADWASQDNYRLYNEVRVEDVNGSGTFTKKISMEQVPDVDGKVIFQVRQAFRGVMKPVPPILNGGIIKLITDRLKFFKHYTGELTGTDVTPASLDASLANIVVWGGIDKFNAGLKTPNYVGEPPAPIIDFFKDLSTTKKFMSWAPLTKMVDPNQEDFLNFFVYDGVHSISQKVKCYYDDGTNQTGNFPGPGTSAGELYEVATGPSNSYAKLVNPAKTLIKYELWLEDALNIVTPVISEVRTYILNPFRYPNTRLFMALNSLGSYEVMCFYGAAQIPNTFERDLVRKYLPLGYYASAGEKAVNNVSRKKKGNYSSGYFTGDNSAAWLDYMNDFMLSEQVYEVTDGKRRPVIITDGTVESEDQNYKRFFRFTTEDGYDNNVYTP